MGELYYTKGVSDRPVPRTAPKKCSESKDDMAVAHEGRPVSTGFFTLLSLEKHEERELR